VIWWIPSNWGDVKIRKGIFTVEISWTLEMVYKCCSDIGKDIENLELRNDITITRV
jgi:hypothetical protein